jgi:hypothetical protein
MKFSVSLINSFDLFLNEKKNNFGYILVKENDIIDMISRKRIAVPRMTFGTAFHSIIDEPLRHFNKSSGLFEYKYDVNANRSLQYDFDGDSLAKFEYKVNRNDLTFEVENYYRFNDVQISMRLDAISPLEVLEFKTEFGFNISDFVSSDNIDWYKKNDSYLNSMQWQIYCLATEQDKCTYHIWRWIIDNCTNYQLTKLFDTNRLSINKLHFSLIEYDTLECYYQKEFEQHLIDVTNELKTFVIANNLESLVREVNR